MTHRLFRYIIDARLAAMAQLGWLPLCPASHHSWMCEWICCCSRNPPWPMDPAT